ncbi:MAG: ABC transporter permease [Candidatus Velamenicoccus archaeovorus]
MSEKVVSPPRAEAPPTAEEPAAEKEHWWDPLVVPVLAVITALAIGALVIVFSDPEILQSWAGFFRHPLETLRASWDVVYGSYKALFTGAFGDPTTLWQGITSGSWSEIQRALNPLSETIVTATPLIFAGLSVAIGFKAGLFNIGAEGQITVGAIVGSMAGFTMTWLPGPIHVIVIVLAGFLGGAVWGAIPGLLKAKTGAHEVITTIMMNYISYRLADYCLSTTFFRRPDRTDPISKPVVDAFPHLLGSSLRVHLGIALALVVSAGVAYLINRTTVGFEFRAVGFNADASKAAGINATRVFVLVMTLAGGLAGLGASNQLLSVSPSLTPGYSSGFGFDAIALALLGRSNAWGVVAAAFLFGALRAGSRSMQAATATPVDIVVVIQALVIVFIAAPSLVRSIYRIKARRAEGLEVVMKGFGA